MANLQTASVPVGQDSSAEASVTWDPFVQDNDTGINEDVNSDEHCIQIYELESRWILNEGLIVVPLAKRPTDAPPDMEFLRLHKPCAFLIVEWAVGRIGAAPLLPIPYLSDKNVVLLRQEMGLAGVDRDRDSRLFFWASGTYIYGAKDRKSTTLSHPVAPYIIIAGENVTLTPFPANGARIFDNNIIDNQWPDSSMHTYLTQP